MSKTNIVFLAHYLSTGVNDTELKRWEGADCHKELVKINLGLLTYGRKDGRTDVLKIYIYFQYANIFWQTVILKKLINV